MLFAWKVMDTVFLSDSLVFQHGLSIAHAVKNCEKEILIAFLLTLALGGFPGIIYSVLKADKRKPSHGPISGQHPDADSNNEWQDKQKYQDVDMEV